MKFSVKSVISIPENKSFKVICCLETETSEGEVEQLSDLCDCMEEVLGMFADSVQPEVKNNIRADGITERTIFYRLISLNELKFVVDLYRDNLSIRGIHVDLDKNVSYYPPECKKIFEFNFDCWRQANKF